MPMFFSPPSKPQEDSRVMCQQTVHHATMIPGYMSSVPASMRVMYCVSPSFYPRPTRPSSKPKQTWWGAICLHIYIPPMSRPRYLKRPALWLICAVCRNAILTIPCRAHAMIARCWNWALLVSFISSTLIYLHGICEIVRPRRIENMLENNCYVWFLFRTLEMLELVNQFIAVINVVMVCFKLYRLLVNFVFKVILFNAKMYYPIY